MRFKLTNSGFSSDLMNEYSKVLKKFNVRVDSEETDYSGDTRVNYSIRINDIETLMSFIKAVGHPIVLNNEEIEIYDYWRE